MKYKIQTMKKYFLLINLLLLTTFITSQVKKSSKLYKTIKEKDSLLFNIGFNTCDITQFKNLVSDNFEFYHDQAGITNSKSEDKLLLDAKLMAFATAKKSFALLIGKSLVDTIFPEDKCVCI